LGRSNERASAGNEALDKPRRFAGHDPDRVDGEPRQRRLQGVQDAANLGGPAGRAEELLDRADLPRGEVRQRVGAEPAAAPVQSTFLLAGAVFGMIFSRWSNFLGQQRAVRR
jgi:hypothetical protein